MTVTNFILNTDGGSRGNPGPSACGFFLKSDDGEVLSGGWFLGDRTNNHAEYCALIWGLENAIERGAKHLEVFADSELMVKQMRGEYRVKNPGLKVLNTRAKRLAACFESFTIAHVYREGNKQADARANEAMDARGPVGTYLVGFDEAQQDACGTASLL